MAGLVAGLGAGRVVGIDTGAVADPLARLSELLDGMPGVRAVARGPGGSSTDGETAPTMPVVTLPARGRR